MLREADIYSESHICKSAGPREGSVSLNAIPRANLLGWQYGSIYATMCIKYGLIIVSTSSKCKCVFSASCPVVVNFISFLFSFQTWIRISSHWFSFHLLQLSSTLFPFFCLWYSVHFPPSPLPFTFLHTCCHCAGENVASYSSPPALEALEWGSQGVESLEQRGREIALGYRGPWAVDHQDPHSFARSPVSLCTHKAWGPVRLPEQRVLSLARGCHRTSQGSWRAFR